MKRIITLLLVALIGCNTQLLAKSVTKHWVKYEVAEDQTARASLTYLSGGQVEILEKIKIGQQEYTVTEIGAAGFKTNKDIKGITLPSTITRIGDRAFAGCTRLEKLVLPEGIYSIGEDAFKDCTMLKDVQGNTAPYFVYMNTEQMGNNSYSKGNVPKFSQYANNKLRQRMEQWQTKKAYETVDQYKARVTKEKRNKRMEEFKEELKAEYVSLFAPKSVSSVPVGSYDSDYEVYTIRTDFYGCLYVQVPKSDAAAFFQNYGSVKLDPHFGVRGDTLAILSCDFALNSKHYTTTANYEGRGGEDYQFDLPELDIDLASAESQNANVDRTIDVDIPQTKEDNKKTFVVVIGNENYRREDKVPYAINDANVFAEYCHKTLGIPKKNIDLYKDATINDIHHAMKVLTNRLNAFHGEAKAIVYYSGHGYPDEATSMPYLMPVDGYASDVKGTGCSLSDIYSKLAEAPSQLTMVFLDACFSGAKREGDMMVAAKSIARAAKSTTPKGNVLVFSASQGTETAYVDDQHAHGRFTYFVLKHLRETKGASTIGQLVENVQTLVNQASVVENGGKEQRPDISPSLALGTTWQTLMLR